MRTHSRMWRAALAGLVTVCSFGMAFAQDAGGARGGNRGGDRGGDRGGRFDPAQMRQRFMDSIKENLQASEEEWAAIQPKLEKVMTLSRESMAGIGMGMRRGGPGARGGMGGPGMMGGPGGNAPEGDATQQSAIAKAVSDLQTTLDNKAATADEIKTKLAALREAREKGRQDLAKAREQLRELLTQRQEAYMVMSGWLD